MNQIAIIIFIYLFISFYASIAYLPFVDNFNSLAILNPVRNYKEWKRINLLGIFIITTLINFVLFPYAIVYWVYKLLTVGRR